MKHVTKTVSILGCGWVGLPLAEQLCADGFFVKGSTISRDKMRILENKGIKAFLLECRPEVSGEHWDDFFRTDVLVVTVPFRRGLPEPDFYRRQIESIAERAQNSGVKFFVFTSSTSVYPETNSEVKESDVILPEDLRGKVLLKTEECLVRNAHFATTIVRLAGLYGYDRQLGKFLSGKGPLGNGNVPVNLVHRDDAVEVLRQIITRDIRHEIINVCCDGHPTRKELYTKAAQKLQLPMPVFDDGVQMKYKIVSGRKLKEILHYRFKYSDPLASLDQ